LSQPPTWNVVVAGGGAAGCATAIGLARRGIDRVCIVDPGISAGPRLGETIPPEARLVLNELGVWRPFLEGNHDRCLGSCSAWGSPDLGYNDFLLNPHGCGWHLDRAEFETMLRHQAVSQGTALLREAKVGAVAPDGDHRLAVSVIGPAGAVREFGARYVVDATGWRSGVARQAGARWRELDRLTFVYGFFDTSRAEAMSKLTLVEANELGWWYAGCLPDRKLAVAFASDPGIVRDHKLTLVPNWLERLGQTRHLAALTQGCRLQSEKLAARVAPTTCLDHACGAYWLAVGDAAAACDPISSQGIMNALEDGVRASDVIAGAMAAGRALDPIYSDGVARRFADYIDNRNYFYGMEHRWNESPFWRRRVNVTL
jgi:flavin-dependent dehydrogenase